MYDGERILLNFGQDDVAKYHFQFIQTQRC